MHASMYAIMSISVQCVHLVHLIKFQQTGELTKGQNQGIRGVE